MSTPETARRSHPPRIRGGGLLPGLLIALLIGTLLATTASLAGDAVPRLGHAITQAEAAGGRPMVFPDGRGLPPGSGDARIGKMIFAQQCANCHGAGGRGGSAPELVGGTTALNSPRPDKTIGLYWPFAPTLFDFNWRAMPMNKPGSLSPDEAYAVTAYLLFAEGLISEDAVMNATSLAAVKMPNRNGFKPIDVK